MKYKHIQIGYLVLIVAIVMLALFVWLFLASANEQPSIDSGSNFLVTSTMFLIFFVLVSFCWLQVSIDEEYLRIKFGWGIFQKKFLLNEIISISVTKNHWYYGWGIRFWFWPKMWIYNVSGFDAVEIKLKNGKTCRIGTDESEKLQQAISQAIS